VDRLTSLATSAGGLGTRAARWAFLFVLACGALQGLADRSLLEAPLLWSAALAVAGAGALALTTPGARHLSPALAAGTVASAGVVAVVALWSAPEVRNLWALDFAAYLATFLIVRGNVVAGAFGSVLVPALGAAWAWPHQPSSQEWALLLGIPIGCIFAASAWRLVLRWIVRQQRLHRSNSARAAERAEADAEALAATRGELEQIGAQVIPLLERLARGEPVDEAMRAALAFTEAGIRDRIRTPQLNHPELVATIEALRRRSVEVVLLGEPGAGSPQVPDALAAAIRTAIAPVRSGRVTVRSLPAGRTAAVSVVIADADSATHLQFAPSGALLVRS
jgi:hypothetical protein